MLWNAQHVGAVVIQERSCFLIDDEVGAEEERATHTYKHINKGQNMNNKIIMINEVSDTCYLHISY